MSDADAPDGRLPRGDEETEAEFLARYDPRAFPCFAVTVAVVVVTIHQGQLAVLLRERDEHPERGAWALPGGFVGPDEDLPGAAWRTLERETGLHALARGIHLEQLATYGSPRRDPRMRVVSAAYLALTPHVALPPSRAGGGRVRFWSMADLDTDDAPRLAFDHAAIVRDGVERARAKLEYTTVALAFVEEPLTLAELRHVYETVWGVALDPSNFRRKVLETPNFVVPLDAATRREPGGGRGRPGELYHKGTAYWLDRAIPRPRTAVMRRPDEPGPAGQQRADRRRRVEKGGRAMVTRQRLGYAAGAVASLALIMGALHTACRSI